MVLVVSISLLEELRGRYPHKFRVDPHSSLDNETYVDKKNPCKICVVADARSPEHCDPCEVNPDRDRLIRSGLLNP